MIRKQQQARVREETSAEDHTRAHRMIAFSFQKERLNRVERILSTDAVMPKPDQKVETRILSSFFP